MTISQFGALGKARKDLGKMGMTFPTAPVLQSTRGCYSSYTEALKEELCKLEKSRTSMIQDHHGNILMKDNEIKE